jgi:hypothetical protein
MAEAGGRGRGRDLAGTGKKECEDAPGVAIRGRSWSGTLGRHGARMRDCLVGDGIKRHHDSKISRRLVMTSSWEIVVGSGESLRAPEMTWRPWIILSSGEGNGTVRYACLNSTVLEMTWLLVSLSTSLKHL